MTVTLDLSSCGWTVDRRDDRCGAPAVDVVSFRLPQEPVPGVVIAEDERDIKMGVCAEHRGVLNDNGIAVSSPGQPGLTFERYGPLVDVIPAGHAKHLRLQTPTPSCIGCDIDFGPAHTRQVAHG